MMYYTIIAFKLFASGLVLTVVSGIIAAFFSDVFELEWPFLVPILAGVITALLFMATVICAIWRI